MINVEFQFINSSGVSINKAALDILPLFKYSFYGSKIITNDNINKHGESIISANLVAGKYAISLRSVSINKYTLDITDVADGSTVNGADYIQAAI